MFADFPEQSRVTQLLQRSLERDRLAHGYLFTGNALPDLENMARTLAKAVNCLKRPSTSAVPLESCDACDSCRRIDAFNHPDVVWLRPESRSRVIVMDQVRGLMQMVNLKPVSARFKVGIIVAADRLNQAAANAFLKTLEEPPSSSILILLSTEPQRMLETILSRCLRLTFAGQGVRFEPSQTQCIESFGQMAQEGAQGLLGQYRLLGLISKKLGEQKKVIEETLTEQSPLEKYEHLTARAQEKLEDELAAAIEAEYRRQRTELMAALHWWLRDVWLKTLKTEDSLLTFSTLAESSSQVAQRLTAGQALENLETVDRVQRQLHSNVQEALALEVAFLKLHL